MLFLSLIFSHLCGDVAFYTAFLARAKRAESPLARIAAIGLHCLIHSGFVFFWLWMFQLPSLIFAALYIFIVHFLIDFGRICTERLVFNDINGVEILERKDIVGWLTGKANKRVPEFIEKNSRRWLLVNFADQTLHLLSIWALVLYLKG